MGKQQRSGLRAAIHAVERDRLIDALMAATPASYRTPHMRKACEQVWLEGVLHGWRERENEDAPAPM